MSSLDGTKTIFLSPDPYSYDNLFQSSNSSSQSCIPPKLDPFDSQMMSFYQAVPPINCSDSLDWVEASLDGTALHISRAAEELYGPVSCVWTDVLREGDFSVKLSPSSASLAEYQLSRSDHVLVQCKGRDGLVWDNVLTGLRPGVGREDKVFTSHA